MPVKLAICGLGYMGLIHLKKALCLDDVEIVALVEKDEAKISKLKEDFDIPCYTDYRKVDFDLDGVIISTPPSTHYEITRFYLERGIHAFVEKPLASTYKEGKELSEIAKKKGLQLQVGFIERYNPAFQDGLQFVESPIFFEAKRMGPYTGRSVDVDVVFDLMIHDLDIISCLKRGDVRLIFARGANIISGTRDEVVAAIEFSDGMFGLFLSSRVSPESERTLRIVNKNHVVKIDFLHSRLTVLSKNKKGFEIKTYEYEKKDLVKEELADFIQAIKGEKEPLTCGNDTLFSLFLAEKIITALKSS